MIFADLDLNDPAQHENSDCGKMSDYEEKHTTFPTSSRDTKNNKCCNKIIKQVDVKKQS